MKKLSHKQLHKHWILATSFLYPGESIKQWCLNDEEYHDSSHEDWEKIMPIWLKVNESGTCSIVLYPDYCYILDETGTQVGKDLYYGKKPELAIYLACIKAIKIINKSK